MTKNRILLSGDYWHADFQTLLASIDVPMLMTPIDKVSSLANGDESFDLIVLAQSRRDQIDHETVELLRSSFATTPIVFVLGSWCEGEPRSGSPVAGIQRIYWHQWQGRYDRFIQQLNADGVTTWHAPATSNIADRIEQTKPASSSESRVIGVSAWTQTQYEMVADGLKAVGYRTKWLERSTWDAEAISLLSAICVDADSYTADLVNRLNWLRVTFPESPMVLILNFPRSNEVVSAKDAGVSKVLSKPFELVDLQSAVATCCGRQVSGDTTVLG